jgi:hypothetical protein
MSRPVRATTKNSTSVMPSTPTNENTATSASSGPRWLVA